MKKFAILLAVLLALSSVTALADNTVDLKENSDTLRFYLTLEDGVTVEQTPYDAGVVGTIDVEALDGLLIVFSLMPDDSYTGLEMNELSDAEVEALSGVVMEDMGNGTVERRDLPCGLQALNLRDENTTEYIDLTLAGGYFMYLEAYHADFTPLSETEISTAKAIFDSLGYEETTL